MYCKLQLTAAFVILAVLTGSPLLAEHGTIFGAELPHVLDFPHFGNGDDVRSELVLVNLGSEDAPMIYFYASNGEMIPAAEIVEITDDVMVMADEGLRTVDPIPYLGEITIATNQTGNTVAGSLSVRSSSRMNGFLRYSLYANLGIAGAGVPSSFAAHNFIVPVQRKEGGINTGLAIHNLSADRAVNVSCDLMEDGMELESAMLEELPANGHMAKFINSIFPDYFADSDPEPEPEPEEDPAPENGDDSSSEEPEEEEEPIEEPESELFRGSVACYANGQITSVALELDSTVNVLTTLPVMLRPSGADFFF